MAVQPFATVEELQSTLQRSTLDRDTALLALQRASAEVRAVCGWTVSREVVTNYTVPRRTRWSSRIFLPTLNLLSVESLTEAAVLLADDADYTWTPDGIIYRSSGWWPLSGILVSYTHGYQDGDWQYGLAKSATLSLAARLVSNPAGHASEQTGSEGWTLRNATTGLTEEERVGLGPISIEAVG